METTRAVEAKSERSGSGVHVLVPIKRLATAKTRLADVLGGEERAALVHAMLSDVMVAIRALRGLDAVTLVSSDPGAEALAAQHGAQIWHDRGLPWNDALAGAMAEVVRTPAVAVVSADIPLVGAEDIERLVAEAPARGIAIARAVDAGTNAVCMRPPGAMATCFGTRGSAARHAALAREAGLEPRIVDRLGTALDLDSPDDVARFLALGRGTRTHALLQELRPFGGRRTASRATVKV